MEDLSSGAVLFARDADRRMPPASLAKMMTVYVAFDMIKKGELKLTIDVGVKDVALSGCGLNLFIGAYAGA